MSRVDAPPHPHAAFVLAHGAGAGMNHPFMEEASAGLAQRGIATLRFDFPFMAKGSRRPDPPAIAHASVREAVAEAAHTFPALPLFAGGKSFGGRMTSQAQSLAPLAGVRGLVFFGFPLHPANRPGLERAAHLSKVALPMLFLQGTRDALAEMPLMQSVVAGLGARARLEILEDADHAFHVLMRSGRTDRQVMDSMLDAIAAWIPTAIP